MCDGSWEGRSEPDRDAPGGALETGLEDLPHLEGSADRHRVSVSTLQPIRQGPPKLPIVVSFIGDW